MNVVVNIRLLWILWWLSKLLLYPAFRTFWIKQWGEIIFLAILLFKCFLFTLLFPLFFLSKVNGNIFLFGYVGLIGLINKNSWKLFPFSNCFFLFSCFTKDALWTLMLQTLHLLLFSVCNSNYIGIKTWNDFLWNLVFLLHLTIVKLQSNTNHSSLYFYLQFKVSF